MSPAVPPYSGSLTAQRPSRHQPSRTSYLLVVLHIVAQTDQTGLKLLGHQGPAVVLRFGHVPNDKRSNIMRVNPNPMGMQMDGKVTSREVQGMQDGRWRDGQTSTDV